jgi:hypothetical protein
VSLALAGDRGSCEADNIASICRYVHLAVGRLLLARPMLPGSAEARLVSSIVVTNHLI